MAKRLVCFDFDGTLIHTPTPESGKPEWEKATGLSWQGRGWWGNPESLNLNVFYPPVNQWVFTHYEKEISTPDTYVFLATGRLSRLEKQVLDVLKLHDIKFDDVFCNTGGETFKFKCYLFEKIIKKNPDAVEFIIFDDRYEHIVKFKDWAKTQTIDVTIVDVINKSSTKIR
jgi:hydroxymethylpyrimidine pyrophosphatase-like HAD family hydrolase